MPQYSRRKHEEFPDLLEVRVPAFIHEVFDEQELNAMDQILCSSHKDARMSVNCVSGFVHIPHSHEFIEYNRLNLVHLEHHPAFSSTFLNDVITDECKNRLMHLLLLRNSRYFEETGLCELLHSVFPPPEHWNRNPLADALQGEAICWSYIGAGLFILSATSPLSILKRKGRNVGIRKSLFEFIENSSHTDVSLVPKFSVIASPPESSHVEMIQRLRMQQVVPLLKSLFIRKFLENLVGEPDPEDGKEAKPGISRRLEIVLPEAPMPLPA